MSVPVVTRAKSVRTIGAVSRASFAIGPMGNAQRWVNAGSDQSDAHLRFAGSVVAMVKPTVTFVSLRLPEPLSLRPGHVLMRGSWVEKAMPATGTGRVMARSSAICLMDSAMRKAFVL